MQQNDGRWCCPQIPISQSGRAGDASGWAVPLPTGLAETLNRCLHTLTELCMSHPRHTAALTRVDDLVRSPPPPPPRLPPASPLCLCWSERAAK